MKKCNADFQFITASENSAWVLNIRGNDSKYVPTPHCYILIDKNENVQVFCNLKKITSSLKRNSIKSILLILEILIKFLQILKRKNF